MKYIVGGQLDQTWSPLVHMLAASAGETVSTSIKLFALFVVMESFILIEI